MINTMNILSYSALEVQTEARQLLYSPRRIEMPVAEHSFDLDLYPHFTEMMTYIEKKQAQRIADKKTVTRGNLVMAFKHDTIKMVIGYSIISSSAHTDMGRHKWCYLLLQRCRPKTGWAFELLDHVFGPTRLDLLILWILDHSFCLFSTIFLHESPKNSYLVINAQTILFYPYLAELILQSIAWPSNYRYVHSLC